MTPYPPDSPFERHTLDEKWRYIRKYSILALVMSIFSFLICGFVGFYSFMVASSVIEAIDYYNIGHDRRAIAMGAKVISLFAAVAWIIFMIWWLLFGKGLPWMPHPQPQQEP